LQTKSKDNIFGIITLYFKENNAVDYHFNIINVDF